MELRFHNNQYCYCQAVDFDFWIKLCLKHDIHILPEKLIKYRVRNNKLNASANKPDTLIRTQFEYKQILENFLKIQTVNDLLKIFPEISNNEDVVDDPDLIPYYVSMQALKTNTCVHNLFGLEVLYKMLSNPVTAKKLKEKCNFNHLDFQKLSGKYVVFNDEELIKFRKSPMYFIYMLLRAPRKAFLRLIKKKLSLILNIVLK